MIGEWGPTTARTVDLGLEQMLILAGRPGTRVKVLYGGIWLTAEGHLQDVFAASGDEVVLQSRGVALVEGLGPARVQVDEPVRASAWSTLRGWAQRAGRAMMGNRPVVAPRFLGAGSCERRTA